MIIHAKEPGYQYCNGGDCHQNCTSEFRCYQNAGDDALNIVQQVRNVSGRTPSTENVISLAPPIPAYNAVTRVETVT